jgi:hypothetical protein
MDRDSPELPPAPQIKRLHEILTDTEELLAASEMVLPASVVDTNAHRIGLDAFLSTMLKSTYRSRSARFDPVRLGRLPAGIRMLGGDSYWLSDNAMLVGDQINPLTENAFESLSKLEVLPFETETIDEECLLVARYGDVTWGHWVSEILPRAIMAERAYPKRFRFVLGESLVTTRKTRSYANAVLESLAAFGIDADRILRVQRDRHYRFGKLFAVSGVWSIDGMNPGVMDIMRSKMRERIKPAPHKKIALTRSGPNTRGFCNKDAVDQLMAKAGFHAVDTGSLRFDDQVAIFLNCDIVFGIQGSALAGLIFAKQDVRVITVAPSAWHDTYFHPIIQMRDGWQADLRGPTLWTGEGLERDAPFLAIEADITNAIAKLSAPKASLLKDGMIELASHRCARRLSHKKLELTFGTEGNASDYTGHGWSFPEATHTWSTGPVSTVHLADIESEGDMVLELDVVALIMKPGLIGRPIEIAIEGVHIGGAMVEGFETLSFVIPADLIAGRTSVEITFVHPICMSPRMTGHGTDDRDTAISFRALRIWDIEHDRADERRAAA